MQRSPPSLSTESASAIKKQRISSPAAQPQLLPLDVLLPVRQGGVLPARQTRGADGRWHQVGSSVPFAGLGVFGEGAAATTSLLGTLAHRRHSTAQPDVDQKDGPQLINVRSKYAVIGMDGMLALAPALIANVAARTPGVPVPILDGELAHALVTLELDSAFIGYMGAQALAHALVVPGSRLVRWLRRVGLRWNSIGDAGVAALCDAMRHVRQHTPRSAAPPIRIETLDLSWNGIGDDGAASLAALLACKAVPTLSHLELDSNSIRSNGASVLGAALSRGGNTLAMLGLSRNLAGATGVEAIANALCASAEIIDVTAGAGEQSENATGVDTADDVEKNGSGKDGDSGGDDVCNAENGVDARRNDHGDLDADGPVRTTAHGSSSALTHLDLSANECGDHGAEALARALHSNDSLTTLRLEQSSVTAAGAKAFAAAMGAQKIGRAKNVTLNSLSLKCNPLGDEGARALSQVFVATRNKDSSLGAAARCAGCELLDLRDTGISEGTCATISAHVNQARHDSGPLRDSESLRLLLKD